MNGRLLVMLIALGRTVLGAVALVAPEVPARPWVGRREAGSVGARVLARALGARDLALGLGAVRALLTSSPDGRFWVAAGGLADGLDAAVTISNWRRLRPGGRAGVLLSAGGAAAVALAVADGMGHSS